MGVCMTKEELAQIAGYSYRQLYNINKELDDDKKAAMVSNLLVVLCGDDTAQPVVNTGTLNH